MSRRATLPTTLILAALVLSGCMEALQTPGPGSVAVPPAAPTRSATQVAEAATTAPTGPAEATPGAPELSPTAGATPPDSTPPQQATLAPTIPPPTETPAAPPPAALPTIAISTPAPISNEARWRAQQQSREVFPQPRTYLTSSSELWWYDPVNQQHIILGSFAGEFQAQAQFVLAGQGIQALEVPYEVNRRYGLTALSPAIIERITAAGYGDWIETYVFLTPSVYPR